MQPATIQSSLKCFANPCDMVTFKAWPCSLAWCRYALGVEEDQEFLEARRQVDLTRGCLTRGSLC